VNALLFDRWISVSHKNEKLQEEKAKYYQTVYERINILRKSYVF